MGTFSYPVCTMKLILVIVILGLTAGFGEAKCVRSYFPSYVHVAGQDFYCSHGGPTCTHDGDVLGCYLPTLQGKKIDRDRTDFNKLCDLMLKAVGKSYTGKFYSYKHSSTSYTKEMAIFSPKHQWKLL